MGRGSGAGGSIASGGKRAGGIAARALHETLGSRARGRFGILYYHRVAEGRGVDPPLNVEPAVFGEQIEGLRDRGYRFRALREVLDVVSHGDPIPPKTVVVTFDDGFRSVYQHAWPVLQRHRVPATVYLATGSIGSEEPFPFDPWALRHRASVSPEIWAPLTWEECAEMARSGLVEIGSHTRSHEDFRGRPSDLEGDVRASLADIESHLGLQASTFSYPYGYSRKGFVDDALAASVERCGLRCGLTTDIRLVAPSDDPFRWGRIEAAPRDTSADLAAKLEGWWEWMEAPRAIYDRVRR